VSESRTTRRPPATGFPAPSGRSDLSRTFLVGASLVLAAAAALPVLAAGAERLSASRARDVQNVMETTSTLSAVAVFALCRARWRLVDERAALWAGAASLLVGVAVAARHGALGAGDPVLTAVGQAAMLVALGLFAAGLTASFETRQIPPLMVVGASFAALAVLTAVFRASPDLGDALTVSPITSSASGLTTLRDVVLAAIWVDLAVAYTVRGLRRRWLYTWGGLMLFALALAQLAGAGEGRDAWAVAGSALLAVGLLVAVGGCSVELAEAYDEQRLRLFDSELDAETAEVRQRLRDASLRRRRHDVINAITTIEGAALVLEREFDSHRRRPGDADKRAGVRDLPSAQPDKRRQRERAGADGGRGEGHVRGSGLVRAGGGGRGRRSRRGRVGGGNNRGRPPAARVRLSPGPKLSGDHHGGA
jgi:hypothetical protein